MELSNNYNYNFYAPGITIDSIFARMVGLREDSVEIAGKMYDFFHPVRVFLFSRNSGQRFWSMVLWHLWIGRARNLGLAPQHLAFEVFNVGGSS